MNGKKMTLITIIFFLITMFSISNSIFAQEDETLTLTLTLDDAIQKALENTHKISELNKTLDDMWEQHNDLVEASQSIQALLDDMDNYERIYKKQQNGKVLDVLEQRQMLTYIYMFGPTPPKLAGEDKFNKYIKNRDFPHYSIWAAYENTKANRDLIKSSISSGIKQLYDSIIDLKEALTLQQELYASMEKQNGQLKIKLEKGQASELEQYLADIALDQQKLEINKFKRTINNVEMSLKQQMGVPLDQEILLVPYDNGITLKHYQAYRQYIDNALENRIEIITAKMDLKVKQRELDIMKEYITDELSNERIDAQLEVDEKKVAVREAEEKITKDIYAGYVDVIEKRKDVNLARKRRQDAMNQYNNGLSQYEKGLIGLCTLQNIETGLTQAKIGYQKAVRDYNSTVHRLETASGIGPGYR